MNLFYPYFYRITYCNLVFTNVYVSNAYFTYSNARNDLNREKRNHAGYMCSSYFVYFAHSWKFLKLKSSVHHSIISFTPKIVQKKKTHLLIFVFTFHKLQEQNLKPRVESNTFFVIIKRKICDYYIFQQNH